MFYLVGCGVLCRARTAISDIEAVDTWAAPSRNGSVLEFTRPGNRSTKSACNTLI